MSQDAGDLGDADGDVIARSVHEPECFGLIWDRYAGDVHRFVMRRLGRDLADDVTAETFAQALRQRARFEAGRSARPWLFGIAANLIGKHRRTEIRGLRAVARLGADPVEGFESERGNHPGGPLPGQRPAGRREGPSPADAVHLT